MTPVVSIVVPVYKGIRFLREALESVKAQSFADWECICVDDGSKDGSGALLDEIAATDTRIVAVHQLNGGTSAARNTALKAVRGRYVMFLDEDDAYHPRMIETLLSVAEKTQADIVGCQMLEFAENAHPAFSDEPPPEPEWQILDRDGIRRAASLLDGGIPFSVWLNIYRIELVRGHEFPPTVRVEQDMVWHYMLLPKVSRYVKIPFRGYAWRSSSIGGLNNPDAESMISWTHSLLLLTRDVATSLNFSPEEMKPFKTKVEYVLLTHVWSTYRRRIPLSFDQRVRLAEGLKSLESLDISLNHRLGHRLWDRMRLRHLLGSSREQFFHNRAYEVIFSLGENCAVASHMRRFGLRAMSGPFDWNGVCAGGLPMYQHFLETGFEDFLIQQGIEPVVNPRSAADDLTHDYYQDRKTGFKFLHDFRTGVEFNLEFASVKRKYDRRIARFNAQLSSGKPVLLIHLAMFTTPTDREAEHFIRHIQRFYDNPSIDLLLLVNDPHAVAAEIRTVSDSLVTVKGEFFSSRFVQFTGNIPLFSSIFRLISYKHRFRTTYGVKMKKVVARFAASFILDRGKRKAYRRRYINTHD